VVRDSLWLLCLSRVSHFTISLLLNPKRLALDQRFCNLVPGIVDNTSEGCSRDLHFFGRFLVVAPLEVGKSYGLQFVEVQAHLLQFNEGNALRLEVVCIGYAADAS